ncbi:MAG: aminotransferase class V-fold PLP-dependent enzyme [Desulfobacterales bacterium]
MNDVSGTFVDMHELYQKADERIAALCQVEDAHITSGAGAAITLAVAGCMAGNDFARWMKLPATEGIPNEVVFPRGHYQAYAPQWTAAGAKLIEYGQAGILKSFNRELESMINEKTCCLSYTLSYNTSPRGQIPLSEVIEIGRKFDIPIVVDAAALLPPVANLRKFTDMGADIVIFSGGKGLRAPASSGMMLGCGRGAEIIASVRNHTYPNEGWARGFKVGKEQIVGLITALEIFIHESDALYEQQMATARYLLKMLEDIAHVDVKIIPNDETFHEHPVVPRVPRVLIQWDPINVGLTAEMLDQVMASEDPPVLLKERHYENYYTNKAWRIIDTYFLDEDEAQIVAQRLKRILTTAA